MYLDTASNSVETSSKQSNMYPPPVYPTNGYEPFSPHDNVGLRTPASHTHGHIATNPAMYGLPASMYNQYSTQALWKAVNNHAENARSDMIVPKTEPGLSDSSPCSSEISLTIEPSSRITKNEQVSPSSSDSGSLTGPAKKKARTVFTISQLRELQSTFIRKKYLTTEERMRLSGEIGLSHTKIKTWFQNRRMKWKRENHCTVPGLIPMMTTAQECLRTSHPSTMLEKSLLAMSNSPVPPPYPTTSCHLPITSSLPILTPSCMASLPQPMYSQTYSNGFYSMNNAMLGHHSMSPAQNLYNNDLRYSPMSSVSLTDAPTYDTSTSCLGYSSKYPYQTPSTYANSGLLMVAPPTQSFLTL